MKDKYRFLFDKQAIIRDFGSYAKFAKEHNFQVMNIYRGVDSEATVPLVPRKYLIDTKINKNKVFAEGVVFTYQKSEATHLLQSTKSGEVILRKNDD